MSRRSGDGRAGFPSREVRISGHRVWDVGDWGNASQHLGRRWEEVGAEHLDQLLGVPRTDAGGESYLPRAVVHLVGEPALEAEVHSAGLAHADALLVGPGDGGEVLLQPVDFKWSLETAHFRQVSTEVLDALAQGAGPLLRAAIETGVAEVAEPDAARRYLNGFFFVPDSRPNRAYLESGSNGRTERPLTIADVHFQPVAVESFFDVLPAWSYAQRLAHLDRAQRALATLDGADRYYRLGAGVAGALNRVHTPVFVNPVEGADVTGLLEETIREHHVHATGELVTFLSKRLWLRRERLQELKALERSPYGVDSLRRDLQRAGIRLPAGDNRAVLQPWFEVLSRVNDFFRSELRERGLELLREGQTEDEALRSLANERRDFADKARALGGRLAAESARQRV